VPDRKGRKRKAQRARRTAGEGILPNAENDALDRTGSATTPGAKGDASSIPALRARYAGFLVAVLTLTIGVLTLEEGLIGDYSAADAALRIGAGIALIVVALVIGVLALVPARVAGWLRR
jgi:hypothetical protein